MICNIANFNIEFKNFDDNLFNKSINVYPFLYFKDNAYVKVDLVCNITYDYQNVSRKNLIFEDDNGLKIYKNDSIASFRFNNIDNSYIIGFDYYGDDNVCNFFISKDKLDKSTLHIIESTPFQLCFMLFLLKNNAILLHSNCIMIDNKVYCFTGESGAGKSTLCNLYSQYTNESVLTDEVTILRLIKNKIYAFGSPWKGSGSYYAANAGKELKKIYYIYHGKSNYIEKINKNKALEILLKQAFPFFWDKSKVLQAIGIINKIIRTIDYDSFYFTPNINALNYLNKIENINIQFIEKGVRNKMDEWFYCIKKLLRINQNKKYAVEIIGNSMYPYFKNGDKVNVISVPESGLEKNDIILYKKWKNNITVHRIIDILNINNKRLYITKGDNNPYVDSYHIEDSNIIGKVEVK